MTLQSYGIVNKPFKIVLNQLLRKKESLVLNNLESDFELFFWVQNQFESFQSSKVSSSRFYTACSVIFSIFSFCFNTLYFKCFWKSKLV